MKIIKKIYVCAAALSISVAATVSIAEVTVLGWPGGPEETALRAVTNLQRKVRRLRR